MNFIFLILVLIKLILPGFSEVHNDCVCGQDRYNHRKDLNIQRIVNGTEARPHKYPWMAYLKDPWTGFCGGSIITDRTILSAAHCVHPIKFPEITTWIVGVHSIKETFKNKNFSYNYLSIHLHPLYRKIGHYDIYDISVFILNRKITFGPKVVPICLPNPGDDKLYWNRKVIVAGWGQISEKGTNTDLLMKTDVVLLTDRKCRNMTELARYNYNAMMCAHEIYRDACQGDSGGPLFVEKSSNYYVILGVVSWGEGCARDFPGVYAKISNLKTLSWIKSISELAEANECRNPK